MDAREEKVLSFFSKVLAVVKSSVYILYRHYRKRRMSVAFKDMDIAFGNKPPVAKRNSRDPSSSFPSSTSLYHLSQINVSNFKRYAGRPLSSHVLDLQHIPSFLLIRRLRALSLQPGNPLIRFNVLSRPMQLRGELVAWRDDDARLGLKEAIDVLKRPVGGFRVQEVRGRDEGSADDGPDDPEFPLQVLDTWEGDLHDHVIHSAMLSAQFGRDEVSGLEIGRREGDRHPIRSHRQTGPLRSHLQRIDLCRIQPRHAKHSHPKAREEYKEEAHTHDTELVAIPARRHSGLGDGNDNPAYRTSSRRGHHNAPAAVALDHEIGQQGEDEIVDGASGGQDASGQFLEVEGVDEDVGHVVAGDIDARDLIHCLHPGAENLL